MPLTLGSRCLALLLSVGLGPALAQDSTGSGPVLSISPTQLVIGYERPGALQLAVTNTGAGTLSWSMRVDQPWLSLQASPLRVPQDTLSGQGPATVTVRVLGVGLPVARYYGRVRCQSDGETVTVPVSLQVSQAPKLGPRETRVDSAAVPTDAWAHAYAITLDQVLTVSLDAVADQLRRDSGLALQDLRPVAATRSRRVYVAAEAPFANMMGVDVVATYVWSSADGGHTWSLVLRATPAVNCDFSTHLKAVALHPDGQRVYLGTSGGLFLDGAALATPPQAVAISALQVTADGRFLYVGTESVESLCEYAGMTLSVAGLYRLDLGLAGAWEDLTTPLVRFVAPLAGLGVDPVQGTVIYLGCESGALFRKEVPAGDTRGWARLSSASVPTGLAWSTPLAAAEPFLRVQPGYAAAWTPTDPDIRWRGGYLGGRDGIVYATCSGSFSHMLFRQVLASRDGGVSWAQVWSAQGFTLAPTEFLLDARGLVGASDAVSVGPWALDPLDPLATYLTVGGPNLVYTARDSRTWVALGQGLPPLSAPTGVAVDSAGVLYVQAGAEVYSRRVAVHPFMVTDATVTPAIVHRGQTAVLRARIAALPGDSAAPWAGTLAVRLQTEPDTAWTRLHDDGLPPDAVAGDGVWGASFTVPADRPYGYYGAIAAAQVPAADSTRASQRASYQVVPAGDLRVFSDSPMDGWDCADSSGLGNLLAATPVHRGGASLRVDGEVTCRYQGEPAHPFGRTCEFWAYSQVGTDSLWVNDARADVGALPAGRWVRVAVPAEQLNAWPVQAFTAAGTVVHPALITELRFRANTPVWLDDVALRAADSGAATAVAEASSPVGLPHAELLAPYPNPFNPTTTVAYRLAQPSRVTLQVYSVTGQLVRQLVSTTQVAGSYRVPWDGRDGSGAIVGCGVYLVVLRAGDDRGVRRMVLLR